MTTITKERLLTIKQWRETYGPGSNVVLPAEEAEELARIALASLEAKPVAWTDEEELRDVRKYGFGEIFQCPPDKYADPRRVISLYRELPAPVVPDDWQLVPKKITLEMECALSKADSYEIGWLWALAAAPKYEVQNAKRVQNALNACRAAMLHSAEPASNHEELPLDYLQGQKDGLEWAAQLAEANHPQTGDWLYDDPLELAKAIRKGPDMPEFDGPTPGTPDGWISCSERMPEETGDIIVVSDGIVMSGISYSRRDGFYIAALEYDDDEPIDGVTHWMHLPEPPQEVK
ncbi:TPA: DUF551 domain-containing protein [Escherichia coli]|nr:DUF551 domain-containing protein [Escherichia coli]